MSHLAEPGDIVLVRHRDLEFENYLYEILGLSGIRFIGMDPANAKSVALQACSSAPILRELSATASKKGGLNIVCYQTTGTAWQLARLVGETSRKIVHVSGPSPRSSRRANDKLWFSQLARAVIGKDAIPPTY